MPVGWQMRGGVNWNLQNVGMPATVAFQLWNPGGLEAFEILPNMNFQRGRGAAGRVATRAARVWAPRCARPWTPKAP